MRLFIAILLTPEMKTALAQAMDGLRAASLGGNFTETKNLHLTLAFIGESRDIAGLRRVIDRCACAPFPLALSGTGRFGELYWVGLEESAALCGLAERLAGELRRAGFPIERRPFRAHITVARQLRAERPPRFSVPRAEMTVRRISLMESRRVDGKLTYTELYGRDLA